MKDNRGLLDFKAKKSLRWGLLLVSTLIIFSASALVYAGITYEKALEVYSTGGVTTGSGPTGTAGSALSTVYILAVLALISGLGLFGFLREAYKRVSKASGGRESSPKAPESLASGEEEWEEAPSKANDEGFASEQ
ncbi:hypothetical protein E6H36_01665 [Candidatus Bathyarchaeota archaeon]|nr:MAG: hypothetical protein E6H36_01665 [Candidatus Bathyarchaeota archaeon]TMI31070.1 MAG: hypothetical protein E6H29_06610 [Candidatus Bathyarchaeota archaeon]